MEEMEGMVIRTKLSDCQSKGKNPHGEGLKMWLHSSFLPFSHFPIATSLVFIRSISAFSLRHIMLPRRSQGCWVPRATKVIVAQVVSMLRQ